MTGALHTDLASLLAYLAPADDGDRDEAAVVSLAAIRDQDRWRLALGSLLIGPREIGELSWPEWAAHDGHPARTPLDVSPFGITAADWRAFDTTTGDWRLTRFPLPMDQVEAWLTELVDHHTALLPDGSYLDADAAPADALISVFPHHNSPTSHLSAMLNRPVLGWAHPLHTATDALPPPDWAPTPAHHPLPATLALLGLSVASTSGTLPPHALLVGRADRPAWFATVRRRQHSPQLSLLDVHLRFNPDRTSLRELVIDLEETTRAGDVVHARRLRLTDIPLEPHGSDHTIVAMPTHGAQLVRRLRLYDLGGRLLDLMDNIILAETINLTVDVTGDEASAGATTHLLGDPATPSLLARLRARDKAADEYDQLLKDGLPGRIVDDRAIGLSGLRDRLRAARGELLVFDPYFGQNPDDWAILNDVTIPIRVLTQKGSSPPRTASIQCRRWRGKAPFHDRGYVWDGAGIQLGTSTNSLGSRRSIVDTMDPYIAAEWVRQFHAWWDSPRAEPL